MPLPLASVAMLGAPAVGRQTTPLRTLAACVLVLSLVLDYRVLVRGAAPQTASRHSVRWTDLLAEPGLNKAKEPTYHNSMPIGNGHMAANVNYESAHDRIAIMIAASSFWLENGETGKVGLLNIQVICLPP